MAAGFKKATVRAADVPSTQTDFPSYVDLDRIGVTTLAEAQSIRVYADEAKTVEWAREIVSATEMHVKVPSLTSTVDIYVDWDGVRSDYAVGATYGRNAVWVDYEFVSHDGGGTDSTGNHSTTAEGGVTSGGITGKIGVGTSYDGSNDGFDTGYDSFNPRNNFTMSVWTRVIDIQAPGWIIGKGEVLSNYFGIINRTDRGLVIQSR